MAIIDILLSSDQTEGTKAVVSHWLFKVGDYVEKNQPIIELETDKVMMEVVAPDSGILLLKLQLKKRLTKNKKNPMFKASLLALLSDAC